MKKKMNKMVLTVMTGCASLAMFVALYSNMSASDWLFHQPQVPERLKEIVNGRV